MGAHCKDCGFDLTWNLECSYCEACAERDAWKSLCLDMGDWIREPDDSHEGSVERMRLLARLDQLGPEQADG